MMNLKLVLVLVVFSVIALQESSGAWTRFRFRLPRIRWRRIIRIPGPIGMPPGGGWLKGRDVESEVDESEFVDEEELAKHLNERDIEELMEALAEADEQNDKN